MGRFDACLVVVMNDNYGNNMTNYALWQVLTDMNLKVAITNTPWDTFSNRDGNKCFLHFYESPYPNEVVMTDIKDKYDLVKINDQCELFIVGSDQIWRTGFARGTNWYSYLDWVSDDKYKISYGTSFAVNTFEGDEFECEKAGYLLGRFQRISVRERSGIDVLKKNWGLDGSHVIDPVFLCDKKHYNNLINKSKLNTNNEYIGMYLWEHKEVYEKVAQSIMKDKDCHECKLIEVVDKYFYSPTKKLNIIPMNINKYNIKIEDWLKMIRDSKFMLTDSFHGLCFSIIFQKQFFYLMNKNKRGNDRVESLLNSLGLMNRILYVDDWNGLNYNQPDIDYFEVNQKLQEIIGIGKKWLIDALSQKSEYKPQKDKYMPLFMENVKLQKKIESIQNKLYVIETKNMLLKKYGMKSANIVVWGSGGCFAKKIHLIKDVLQIKLLCDSDSTKWGIVDKGIKCISPIDLQKIEDIFVIIMVENEVAAFEIKKLLVDLGIERYMTILEWEYEMEKPLV